MPVVFNSTNGTLYTNYVAAFSVAIDDIELVTFSNATPANPFWLMPTNATSYVPTNFIGEQVMWMRNNANGTIPAPHMNLQAIDMAPPFPEGAGVADPASPFYDGIATSGDSGSPVFTLLRGGSALRPVLLYSLHYFWNAGPWVSSPGFWPSIQPLLGTNQVNFVDLSGYKTAAPNIPPDGTVNVHAGGLPMALTISPDDDIVINKRMQPGQPVTQRISGSNFLNALIGFPNWPPFSTNGGGGGGVDIRPLNNTFSGLDSTFNAAVTVNGAATFNGRLITVSTNSFSGPTYATGFLFANSLFAGIDASLAQTALWFSDPPQIGGLGNYYGLITVPRFAGSALAIYAGGSGTDRASLLSTTPVLIQNGNITAGGAGITHLNGSAIDFGIVGDGFLSGNVTKQGNAFNNPLELVRLDSGNRLPPVDASLLTSLNALALTGTILDARLSGNVTMQGNTFNVPSALVQLNGSGQYPALDGSLIQNLNASALGLGVIPNARIDRTNSNFYVTGGPSGSVNIWSTTGTLLASISNSIIAFNTNTVVSGMLTIISSTNTDWTVNNVVTGWLEVSNSIHAINFNTPSGAATAGYVLMATSSRSQIRRRHGSRPRPYFRISPRALTR